MTIVKNSFVKQVEINSGGGMRISVYKQIMDDELVDSDKLIFEEPHRIMIDLDDDFNIVIEANNRHLEQMGYPAIDPLELELATKMRAVAHKHPPVIERMKIERQLRKEAREQAAKEQPT